MELISKKKLLETIEPMVGKFDDDGEFWWSRESILRAINNAPTIEERNEGEWIHESCSRLIDETDEGRVYAIEKRWNCSLCGFSKGFRMYRPDEKYCPNCGAKMKGE